MQHDRIAVVDFGGQYAHLIATKVRRLHVRADILEPNAERGAFAGYKGLILSGSPAMSSEGEGADYSPELLELPVPILGLCFGHQEIAKHYGGDVRHAQREYGYSILHLIHDSAIFKGLGPNEVVWMSHGDSVASLPDGFVELGYSAHVSVSALDGGLGVSQMIQSPPAEHRYAAIADPERGRYGFQFHPEVDDTENGDAMLRNFAVEICGCRPTWTVQNYIEDQKRLIGEQVGDRRVFLLVSGGVDSTVCARLLLEALGPDRVDLLHIDNGLMRKNESRQVVERFRDWGVADALHFVDATDAFLDALEGLAAPEEKRIAVGNTFIEVCEREMKRLDLSGALLAQGTIYPDTIETGGTRRADVIKTHHNRVPLVEDMIRAGRVLEPLKELYKVEVRELGEDLGIEHDFLYRQPFPGPGLGVRLLCSPSAHIEPAGAEELEEISLAAAALASDYGLGARALPVKSVGVKGDLRSYEWPVLLWRLPDRRRAGEEEVPWPEVLEAANLIYQQAAHKEGAGVNRCVYELGSRREPPVFSRRAAFTTRARLELLREADHLVMEAIERYGLTDTIWQCPTVALPVAVDDRGEELIVTRPVLSERAMTARPALLPGELLSLLHASIVQLPGVSGFCIDVTTKPPGTIEWE